MTKKQTVFLVEMTNRELEMFLQSHDTVIIPVGSTEQHGPHSPLGTDRIIAQEVARRVAEKIAAVVAPPLSYCLSYPHRGFAGEFSLCIETFMAVVRDLVVAFARSGFRRIIFLNGHYDNTYPIAYACAQAAEIVPPGQVRAFPLNYWDGLTPEQAGEYISMAKGMHANAGEVSALLAIDPQLVDVEQANEEFPNFPETKTGSAAVHTAFFFTSPGSVYRITRSGTWGDARQASAEQGEKFLEWGVQSVLNLLDDIDRTFDLLPIR